MFRGPNANFLSIKSPLHIGHNTNYLHSEDEKYPLGWGPLDNQPHNPGIPTTIKTMGVNITTIAYLWALIIEIGSTIILMVVEARDNTPYIRWVFIGCREVKQRAGALFLHPKGPFPPLECEDG